MAADGTPIIVFCPCCAASVDGVKDSNAATASGQEFECVNCGQTWTMPVDTDRLLQHAL
jgi:transposase-like protein